MGIVSFGVIVLSDLKLQSEPLPTLEKIQKLQAEMKPFACVPPEPVHHFAPGMYLRELSIPAGMLVVGKIHKHSHFLILSKGKAQVVSEFGNEIINSGHVSVSQAGVKRVVLAIEDCLFLTVHLNKSDSEDLEVIESDHIEPEFANISESKKGSLS